MVIALANTGNAHCIPVKINFDAVPFFLCLCQFTAWQNFANTPSVVIKR